jgi:putative cell wall-binding protein
MVMVPKRREVEKMRRCLMLVVAVALAALVFAPAAFAQDDNPSGDDLRGDDRGGVRGFDDNPTGDDVVASPTATATPTASATPTATVSATDDSGTDTTALPTTGGAPILSLLSAVAGVLLIGSGTAAAMLLRRRTS